MTDNERGKRSKEIKREEESNREQGKALASKEVQKRYDRPKATSNRSRDS